MLTCTCNSDDHHPRTQLVCAWSGAPSVPALRLGGRSWGLFFFVSLLHQLSAYLELLMCLPVTCLRCHVQPSCASCVTREQEMEWRLQECTGPPTPGMLLSPGHACPAHKRPLAHPSGHEAVGANSQQKQQVRRDIGHISQAGAPGRGGPICAPMEVTSHVGVPGGSPVW